MIHSAERPFSTFRFARNHLPFVLIPLLLVLISPTAYADEHRLHSGDRELGILDSDDPQFEDNCYYDSYAMYCRAGNLLTVTQSSTKVDSYLIVTGPGDVQWENDDYSFETGSDSRLVIPVPRSGDYEISCTTHYPQSGSYQLDVQVRTPPRFFGVFVGVSDYGWALEEAPACDLDAKALCQAFFDVGLMNPEDSVLLVNSEATLMSLENALHEVGTEIGPNDVFVFFFSGHGDHAQVSSRDRAGEIDGLDEVISLRDTDLADNDLSRMLEGVKAGLTLVMIDACYSGGFAEDIVNRPDVVLLASSEEDVVSDYATSSLAGGYLGLIFRDAILDAGDLDGDGVVMIGELIHYIGRRFYQEWPEPLCAMYGYQELVHDRGAVSQDTVLFWWNPD